MRLQTHIFVLLTHIGGSVLKKVFFLLLLNLAVSGIATGQNTNIIDSLLSVLKTTGEDTARVEILCELALEYTYVSDPVAGNKCLHEAIALATKLNFPKGLAEAYDIKGIFYYDAGKLDSALHFYIESLKISQRINDPENMCGLYDKIGQIYCLTEDFEHAWEYYDKGYKLSAALGSYRQMGNASNGLAAYYINLARYEFRHNKDTSQYVETYNKATPYLLEAANRFEKAGYRKGTALIYGNLAFTRSAVDDFDGAITYALKALDYFERNNFSNYLPLSYNQITNIYFQQKEYAKSLIYARKFLALGDSAGSLYERSDLYNNLSRTYEALGDYKSALHYANLNKEIYKEIYDQEKEEQLATVQARFNTEQKEQENLLLRKEAELSQATIKRQNIVTGVIAGILIVVGLVSFLTYRNLVAKKKFAAKIESINTMQSRWFINIAHELRTPLTLILGPIASVLKRDENLSEKSRRDIQLAGKNGEQLLKLVNQILDISRMDAGNLKLNPAPVEINALVKNTAAFFDSYAAHKNIQFDVKTPGDVKYLMVDEEKIKNIVVNLTSNALKFTQDGGSVQVEVSQTTGARSSIAICVRDTGEGIPEVDLPFVFDRFYQVAKPGRTNVGGSGIGLALSQELAKLHGGTIDVTSEEGRGSEFTLLLPATLVADTATVTEQHYPVAMQEEDESLLADDTLTQTNGRKPTILVVEDNPDMRQYIHAHLCDDYDVVQAVDGHDAMSKLETLSPDLIISDVMMPRVDGLELARKLKESERHKTIPFITLTARADERDKLDALRIGIDDYILKPFNPEELLVRAHNLIHNARERFQVRTAEAAGANADVSEMAVSYESKLMKDLEAIVETRMNDTSFSVKELADAASMSESTLHRAIKRSTGFSPGQFIREIRLSKALLLLEKRQFATIAEVVQEVGFENNAHFSTLFKKRYGKSPSSIM